MGSRLTNGLSSTFTKGATVAGAAASAAIGTALYKGFDRLSAIDQAKAKLAGLGNSTQTTASVMDSALASVKGTAFGLGDAATISASAIAAGIKPGQDLTKYLKMTADAATIAGTSLGDMGAIFGQVQTGQQAYTDDLNQLADRGIPIYQWLGKEAGVAASDVKGLASDGKISSEMLFSAIQKNIGGAALQSGKTVKGSFDNVIAAMGRMGAAVEGPTFKRLPAFFGDLTGKIDAATPRAEAFAKAFDARVFDNWVPRVKELLDTLKSSGQLDVAKQTFTELFEAMRGAAPSIGQVASALGQASAALGVSGWQIFITALQAGTTALNAINPLLQTVSSFMSNHQSIVTAAAAAWLAFKTIPGIVGRISGPLSTANGQVMSFGSSLRAAATANGTFASTASAGTFQMGRFGSAIAQVGQTSPIIARMQQSFLNASTAASGLPRTMGAASAAATGLRGGVGLLSGALGGPLGLALTGGALALGAWSTHQSEARQKAQETRAAIDSLSESINANNGALDAQGKKQIFNELQSKGVFTQIQNNRDLKLSMQEVQAAGEGQAGALDAVNQKLDQQVTKSAATSDTWNLHNNALQRAGVSLDEYTAALRGNGDAREKVEKATQNWSSNEKINNWDAQRRQLDATSQAALKVGDALGSSNDKLDGARLKAQQAQEALGLVGQRLNGIAQQFAGTDKLSIDVDTTQVAGAETALQTLGIKTQTLPNGQVRVTAESAEAKARLDIIANNVTLLSAMQANPHINLDTAQFNVGKNQSAADLQALNGLRADPAIGAEISQFLDGRNISWSQLQELDTKIADPTVRGHFEEVLKNLGIVSDDLTDITRPRTIQIGVNYNTNDFANAGEAQRARRGYATGGWTGPGSKYQAAGVVHADEFVVQKTSRRSIESTHPGALDYMNRTGKFPGYADGGRVKAADFDALAKGGFGASRPLEGAPYEWASFNWGDCSATASAFARLAAGLDPFGGRFATASAAAQLAEMGAQQGRGTLGDLRIAFYNGGEGGGHAATTLPSGINAEMGGNRGNGQYGGAAAGADHPQFTDHWFFPRDMFRSTPQLGGDDVGGLTQGAYDPQTYTGTGNYSGANSGRGLSGTTGSDTNLTPRQKIAATFSDNLGNAASAAVKGQLTSLFGILSINDSPGALAAVSTYQQQREEMLNQQKSTQQSGTGTPQVTVTDPGTQKPATGQDLGGKTTTPTTTAPAASAAPAAPGLPSTGSPVKDAFRSGLRAAWRQGQPWIDTDWIANHESTWNPLAQNGKYWGIPQAGPEVYAAAGKDAHDPDPKDQGQVYDKYVGDRYKDPMGARAHWEANNWYDQGGVGVGTGLMAKNIITPERVLSTRQTESFEHMVRRDFQRGGGDNPELLGVLTDIKDLLAKQPLGGTTNNHFRNERDYKTAEQKRKMSAALAGH
ncbi:aggregation-promoting factor C-terminal-like domain-containing protein [Williamsia sterculiae]|nr:tape measure protein [Williamsia sterculiae]